MDRQIEGRDAAEYLWAVKRVVPFLKVDKGLAGEVDGVQVMKPIPDLDALTVAWPPDIRSDGAGGSGCRDLLVEVRETLVEARRKGEVLVVLGRPVAVVGDWLEPQRRGRRGEGLDDCAVVAQFLDGPPERVWVARGGHGQCVGAEVGVAQETVAHDVGDGHGREDHDGGRLGRKAESDGLHGRVVAADGPHLGSEHRLELVAAQLLDEPRRHHDGGASRPAAHRQSVRGVVGDEGGRGPWALVVLLWFNVPAILRIVVLWVPFAIVSWWLVSPFFVDDVVEEDFSTSIATQLDEDEESTTPDPTVGSPGAGSPDPTRSEDSVEADSAEEPVAEPAVPVLVGAGQFVGLAGHSGTGDAGIFRNPDGSYVLRFENFDIENGPDLEVYLVPGADRTTLDPGSIQLGHLRGNVGNQTYDLPPGDRARPGSLHRTRLVRGIHRRVRRSDADDQLSQAASS
jgi:hypothetical protein